MNVLKGCIIFLTWAARFFYLKQKQKFSVWSFTENASFISFDMGSWSIYSDFGLNTEVQKQNEPK